MPAVSSAAVLRFDRSVCQDEVQALNREWLVTNGLGGFASGTVAGAQTRRYHGWLFAALEPPLGRTLLASKLDETVSINGSQFPLFTNCWSTGIETPNACGVLESFELQDGIPTWRFNLGDAVITKRIWMIHGRNATFAQYVLEPESSVASVDFAARLFVNHRDYHALTSRESEVDLHVERTPGRVRVSAGELPGVLVVRGVAQGSECVSWDEDRTWYRDYLLPVEAERGFHHFEHHLSAAIGRARLHVSDPLTFVIASEPDAEVSVPSALESEQHRARELVTLWKAKHPSITNGVTEKLGSLALAADQFLVRRPTAGDAEGRTIIAGYPWFSDWGRDTMVALPGLSLATGRVDVARRILVTWSDYVDAGMIPNRFPDEGERPAYNTADAALWYIWAIHEYFKATNDTETLGRLFPCVEQIIDWHRRGTRHRIQVAEDGLLFAGEPGSNLTWMDAKVNDVPVTPRIGKPVELNVLWYNALHCADRWARVLKQDARDYLSAAEQCRSSFGRFWDAERKTLIDVLDGEDDDRRVLPNQIFAVSLDETPLSAEQQAAVLTTVQRSLLTPYGLRTLPVDDANYHGHYAGDPATRDAAYHTGTAWGWLLGPFVIAHFRVHQDPQVARHLLEPLLDQLSEYGVGTLGEIFDGTEPHVPRGAPAQAWTVAETLRAWHVTQR